MKLVGGKRAPASSIKPRLKKCIREALLQHVHIFKGFCAALLQQEQLSEERAELQSLKDTEFRVEVACGLVENSSVAWERPKCEGTRRSTG